MPAIRGKIESILRGNRDESDGEDGFREMGSVSSRESGELSEGESVVARRVVVVSLRKMGVVYWLLASWLQVVVMLLIMSMNAFVILAVIVGVMVGFVFFDRDRKPQEKRTCDSSCHSQQSECR